MEKTVVQDRSMEKKTYTVSEVAQILGIKERNTYNLCRTTTGFRVLRLGRTVRVHKESFDEWFACS